MSWFDAPAPRPAPAAARAALPVPAKSRGSSWLDAPPRPTPAAPVPIAAGAEPVPSAPPAIAGPDPGALAGIASPGAVRVEAMASEPVSAEPEPTSDPVPEEVGPEPVEPPVFPLGRVFDNCPSRASELAVPTPAGQAIIVHPTAAPAVFEELAADPLDDAADRFAAAATSAATRRAYLSDLRDFAAWCRADGAASLPATPRTVSRYLTHLAGLGRSVSTIDRRAAAIAFGHRKAGLDTPTAAEEVRAVLSGIRNTLGRRPTKKKALTADLVGQVVKKIPGDLAGLRDRAMILLCFGAALRRSELVGLDIIDLEPHRRGLLVRLGKTKTDQTGQGRTVAVLSGKLKVPEAVAAWLAAAGISGGPVFRGCDRGRLAAARLTAGQFARVLKARCAAVGIDPDLIGGHSPRRGFATTAGDVGADIRRTAGHMRHAKLETTMGYMEDGDLFRENAGRGFM